MIWESRGATRPRGSARVAALTAVVGAMLGVGAFAGIALPAEPVRTWAVLGDSISSGFGIADTDDAPSAWGDRQCARGHGRNGTGFAMSAGANAALGGRYEQYFVACSGALSDDWAVELAEAYQQAGVAVRSSISKGTPTRENPLVNELDTIAASGNRFDLISFTFGANNVALGAFGPTCMDTMEADGSRPTWASTKWGACDLDTAAAQSIIDVLSGVHAGALPAGAVPLWSPHPEAGHVEPLLSAIGRFVKPGGTVLVMGYPRFVSAPEASALAARWKNAPGLFDKAGNCDGMTPEAMNQFRATVDVLNAGIKSAAAKANTLWSRSGVTFRYVDMNSEVGFDTGTADHGICSTDPWINATYEQPGPLHPNTVGHTEAGKALAAIVRSLS
ncbi:MAG: hypothetical protein Q4G51_07010 [Dermatophilus congolensis]|nr:hypothetical protein [Dermatophilus congolensis]